MKCDGMREESETESGRVCVCVWKGPSVEERGCVIEGGKEESAGRDSVSKGLAVGLKCATVWWEKEYIRLCEAACV